jgi:hypothetical protein
LRTRLTLLMLAMLPKTIVANLDMLLNSHSRLCTNWCNYRWTVSKI